MSDLMKNLTNRLRNFVRGSYFSIGNASPILRSVSIPNLPIELSSSQLFHRATLGKHDYDLSEIKDLPEAITNPIAMFAYGGKKKAQHILTAIEYSGEKFLVGLFICPTVSGNVLGVNSIRNVFPKNSESIISWINGVS